MKTEAGKIGSVIVDKYKLLSPTKKTSLYKDNRYVIWAKGCMFHAQIGSVVAKMNSIYNESNPDNEEAYGMADIEFESTIDFIFPCLRLKGTPLTKKKHKSSDFIPVELNYL